jgi:anti-sigma factor RsiW
MNCPKIQDLLKPLLDGKLRGDIAHQVRKHIATCTTCRSGLSPQDLMEILPVLDESIDPSEDFASRFYAELEMQRLRRDPEKRPHSTGWKLPWSLGWSWRVAAAGLLIVFVAAGLYVRQSPYRRPDTAAVFYEIEVTENLQLLKDMAMIENLELFEDLDTIEDLPQLN